MAKERNIRIGLALIFAIAVLFAAECYVIQFRKQLIDFHWVKADDAEVFSLAINAPAWRWLTDGTGQPLTVAIRSNAAHMRLQAIVERAMRGNPYLCPGHWLLREVRAIDEGGVLVSGYCATQDELTRALTTEDKEWQPWTP
jgi:hypothetical protein